MADRRLIVGAILVVVIVVVLAAVTAYYMTRPASIPGTPSLTSTCAGTTAYSGVVQNDSGTPVPGVVVSLSPAYPNTGTSANATTDSNGSWSATLSGVCPYDARLYWQSVSNGPLLASSVNLTASSTVGVHVSWKSIALTLLNEFPHNANATVKVTIPDTFTFFVEANSSGSIPLGFLPTDPAGSPGYGFTMSGGMAVNGSLPYTVIIGGVRAYKVQDANGNSVVYAKPVLIGGFGSVSATDPLNMSAAITAVQSRGGVPYVQAAARSAMASRSTSRT